MSSNWKHLPSPYRRNRTIEKSLAIAELLTFAYHSSSVGRYVYSTLQWRMTHRVQGTDDDDDNYPVEHYQKNLSTRAQRLDKRVNATLKINNEWRLRWLTQLRPHLTSPFKLFLWCCSPIFSWDQLMGLHVPWNGVTVLAIFLTLFRSERYKNGYWQSIVSSLITQDQQLERPHLHLQLLFK